MQAGSVPSYDHLIDLAPLLVQVELTEDCNLRCRFCYNSQRPRYCTNAIPILESLARQQVMQVTLTGGEPLLHPGFFDVLRCAVELFPNVMILSNGTLMNDVAVKRLHEFPIVSVSVSVHGIRKTHDALTGVEGSFDRTIRAIREFLERDKIPIASNFVLNAANAHELGEVVEFFQRIGLRYMTITRFLPVGVGANSKHLCPTGEQLVEAFHIVDLIRREETYPHIEIAEAIPFCALPPELQYLANTCSYGYDRFYVDVTGELMVCGLSRIKLGGNILTKSISEIKCCSPVFAAFVRNEHVPARCKTCKLFPHCHGGCRAAAKSTTGEWCGTRDYHMAGGVSRQNLG
ncbi:Radical SAM domain heme biosynthesis protein [Thermogutta terrifontis]|uniref:Radical SAM domain heme biosynthesis protein n=1 Tax=Thermogutta terrifontis TaxID=1331910 RepID=A0A286RLI5_9BACT|nr:Radical SAM domain heme biosynthesis protein [Thermogutta terrifontis]